MSLHLDKRLLNETRVEDVPVSATVGPESSCQSNNSQLIVIQWSTEDPNIPDGVLNRNLTLKFTRNDTQTPPTYGISQINAVYEVKTYNKTVNRTDPKTNTTTSVNLTVTDYISMSTFTMNPSLFIVPQNRYLSSLCIQAQ